MISSPRVSIITPTRNRRNLLIETLASVRDQTLTDWEYIVVDDNSSDGTAEYLETLSHPQIVTQRLEKHGERSAARNLGLSLARAPYVMFLDDDDLLRRDALAVLTQELDADATIVAAVGSRRYLEKNRDSTLHFQISRPQTLLEAWKDLLFHWTPNSGQNLYRTDAVRAVGGYNPRHVSCEDRGMWLQIARLGPVRVLPQVVLEYRQHDGQSKPKNIDQIRERVIAEFIETLPPSQRQVARDLRAAAALFEQQQLAALLQAVLRSPHTVRSPISRRPVWWQLRSLLFRSGGR
ncbi:glycosyltransferase family 2 protein [Bryobacter aggregatus]|uniref:glycosyltransferase family 2 protein n=1 Tax=Bryobacter aggregatus TaxID=360054 RepID=UPI0004E2673B|nr:glycosyltransferase family A protein [Bryobacter aggregatus]